MKALEFVTEVKAGEDLHIPTEVAAQLPESAHARVILLLEDDAEDQVWRRSAYERFMKDEAPEDSVYDKYAR